MLGITNGKWRSWKTRLFNKFIVPNQNDKEKLQQPPPDSGIHPVDWKQFVDSRMSDEFKDAYLQEKDEGTFASSEEFNDVLSRALEKPERPGRVRAIGGGITHGIYFRFVGGKKVKIEDSTLHELEQAKKVIAEQGGQMKSLHNLVSELVIRLGNVESKLSEKDKISEGLGSCSVKAPLHDEHDMGKAIELLEGPSERVVAYGTMVDVGGLLHGVPMPEDSLRVSIDEVVDDSAILSFRVSDYIATVESALGTHVAWPANFVVERSNQKPTSSKKKVSKKLFEAKHIRDVASLPTSLSTLYFVMETSYKNDKGLRVTIPFEVFGIDITIWLLLSEDVAPFCNLDPITRNCIVVYVCIHWILTIIHPHKDTVYLLDPLSHRNRDRNWAKVVDTAMNIFKGNNGATTNIKKLSLWKFIRVQFKMMTRNVDFM